MKFIIFSFDGGIFPVAKKLQDEGNEVYVCQIVKASEIGEESWVSEEDGECMKRRLSLYDGMLEKWSLDKMMDFATEQNPEDFFVIFDYNNLFHIAEKFLEMGYGNGIFPTKYDYEMEKDRDAAKSFLKKNYPDIKLKQVKTFSKVEDAIKFIQESDKIWVAKSDGNFAETLVPDKDNLELSKKQIIGSLNADKSEWEKSSITLEEKIVDPIEFTPQMAFYNGKPIYSQVEIETRMIGCLDIGAQTGGNENLILKTKLDSLINKICFPPIVHEEAKKRKGLYLRDAGILSDGKDLYFTEFAGNRWGWGGIFSELSACMDDKGSITPYFEKLIEEKDPYNYQFGVGLALYTLYPDDKHPGLPEGDTPMTIQNGKDFFMVQVKKLKNKLVNVGYRWFGSAPMGYVIGRGNEIEDAVDNLYDNLDGFSFKGVYYRPKSDFLSWEISKCILRRYDFLQSRYLR